MSENLRIFLRIKPSNPSKSPFSLINSQTLLIPPNKNYSFDQIFPNSGSQKALFLITAKPLIKPFLSGYNCSYFVNGQTGTGKTYSMGLLKKLNIEENEENNGIIPQFLRNLFEEIEQNNEKNEVFMSFFQIYCDEIRDLLNPEAKGLIIQEKKENNETFIRDLIETPIKSLEEAYKMINAGLVFRKIASQVTEKLYFLIKIIRKSIKLHREVIQFSRFIRRKSIIP